jgi:hypothetical protein
MTHRKPGLDPDLQRLVCNNDQQDDEKNFAKLHGRSFGKYRERDGREAVGIPLLTSEL